MKVRFWGVRGSTPTPSPDDFRYGGNTPCVEVRTPKGEILILDGGSGLRMLGKQLLLEFGPKSLEACVFFSHYHWDHIQGIPFFEPLYNPENHFYFHSFPAQTRGVQEILEGQMSYPFFPVDMNTMRAHRHFDLVKEDSVVCRGVMVKVLPLNHPQGCLGYRLECNGHVLVYATDNEPGSLDHDRNVRKLAEKADVFIYDAQYTPLEYASQKKGWGHSTWREAVNIAQEAQIKQLVLFHHDPDHKDAFIDSILSETRKFFPNSVAAWEGMEIDMALDEHLKPQDQEERRRNGTRQVARVPLKIRGQLNNGAPFEEQTMLENLTLHGAYFLLENDPDPQGPLEIEFQASLDALFGQSFQVLKSQLVRSHAVKKSGQLKRGIAVVFH
ncbi:MAG: MBL fold metallo-hydrolase [Acidobacteria bacterium]|nr:MBL fold metallo-hydrolase [Acidobacteriota bacterium]